jgi:exopolysaccharide production protein ExoZ
MAASAPPQAGAGATPGRFGHLQQVRAIAALMVVLEHARFAHYPRWGGEGFGTLGVDLFFVISGFVIFWVTRRETSFTRYLLRRIIRIVPLYWMLTLVMAAAVLRYPQVFEQTVFDLVHFLKSLAFVPAFNPSRPNDVQPLLTPGWTLNYEMFFYLSFGFVFFACRRFPSRLLLLSALFLALVVAGGVFAPAGPLGITYTSPKLLEFLAGIWIGVWIDRGTALPAVTGALACLFAGWLCLAFEPQLSGWGAPVGAGLVVLGAVSLERVRRVANRTMEFLGDASYSIYLTHVFALGALRRSWVRVPALNGMPHEPFVFMLVGIVLSACVGALAYVAFERPLLRYLGRFTERPAP